MPVDEILILFSSLLFKGKEEEELGGVDTLGVGDNALFCNAFLFIFCNRGPVFRVEEDDAEGSVVRNPGAEEEDMVVGEEALFVEGKIDFRRFLMRRAISCL